MEGLILFNSDLEPQLQWDSQIQSVCGKVNDIIDSMAAAHVKVAAT